MWVGSGADVLLCNILAPVIMELATDFAQLLKPAGGAGLAQWVVAQPG